MAMGANLCPINKRQFLSPNSATLQPVCKIAEINEFSASDEMYSPDPNKPLRTNALENR